MTWLPEAGELQLGSSPCAMMLSPERLALPDYEYLGRSLGEGNKCRQIRRGRGRGLCGTRSSWDGEERGRGRVRVLSPLGPAKRKTAPGE